MVTRSLWQAFTAANRRICRRVLQPRLYTTSHMGAVEYWFMQRVKTLERRGSALEFGSGTTFPLTELVGAAFDQVCATDVDDVPQSAWPAGVTFRRCTPTAIPFDDDQFDAVLIRSVLEHVEEPEAVFREFHRVLKPGGLLFANLPNKWDYVSVMASLAGGLKSKALAHVLDPQWDDFPVFYRVNTRKDLERVARQAGLLVRHFHPLPSEPAYLSFFVPLYVVGAVYQFLISLLLLDALQPAFLVILEKPKSQGSHGS